MTPNIGITSITTEFGPFVMENSYRNTFRTIHDSISSNLIATQHVVTLYRATTGGQTPKFWPKMTPNMGIMQITSQLGPFDNTK